LDYATHNSIEADPAADVRSIPGKGLLGTVQGKNVAAGNSALMPDQGVILPESAITRTGETALYIAVDGRYAGLLAAHDQVRPGAAEAVSSLRRTGLRTIMLTGDNRAAA